MKRFTSAARLAAALFVLLVLACPGYAQNITGSITGRVPDPTGSVIANANVTLTEESQNVSTTRNTTGSGGFSIPGLMPGTYTLTVEAPGFKKLVRSNVKLDPNDRLA